MTLDLDKIPIFLWRETLQHLMAHGIRMLGHISVDMPNEMLEFCNAKFYASWDKVWECNTCILLAYTLPLPLSLRAPTWLVKSLFVIDLLCEQMELEYVLKFVILK